MLSRIAAVFVLCASICIVFFAACPVAAHAAAQAAKPALGPIAGMDFLTMMMDQYHLTYDVYTDSDAAGNHFPCRGEMGTDAGSRIQPAMNEKFTSQPSSGIDCIECRFIAKRDNWAGWYFMNGTLTGEQKAPQPNWGTVPDAGLDLSGARTLSFFARGQTGGERVKFFALGVGRDADSGKAIEKYPDSARVVTTGYVTLSNKWQQYSLDVSKADLSYCLGGFGWATSSAETAGKSVIFYLDDIQYRLVRVGEPRLLASYRLKNSQMDCDKVLRNTSFVYDNALAILAFLATGEDGRARLVADALVYAQQHDRFFDDGRLRNAYQAGDLSLFEGWTPYGKAGTIRMPGWYDAAAEMWYEDEYQVSTDTGNMAWAMIALLASYVNLDRDPKYLSAAEAMGEWVVDHMEAKDEIGGYYGCYFGWETDPPKHYTYRVTEHNIDLYAAFARLYKLTGDEKWKARADHARLFIEAMWDPAESKFWTGTEVDMQVINRKVVPLDSQAWAILALREDGKKYLKGLDYVETRCRSGEGYDFSVITDPQRAKGEPDGIWYEGTAQMAAVHGLYGDANKAQEILKFLKASQDHQTHGLYASSKDGLTTGFDLLSGGPWYYFRRLHVGATAWLVLAQSGVNPYWLGDE